MIVPLTRRAAMRLLAALPAVLSARGAAGQARTGAGPDDWRSHLRLGAPGPFDFERLTARAEALAAAPHVEAPVAHADLLESIDYAAYQGIRYRADASLWRDEPGLFPAQLFFPGRYFKQKVAIHVVEGGAARTVPFDRGLFEFDDPALAGRLPDDLGFAGFRLHGADGRPNDWLAFLGASYFRSAGAEDQYGMSARGIAVDTAMSDGEEFPRFTDFWLEQDPADRHRAVICALLDGPSLAGAYRFDCRFDADEAARTGHGPVMHVTARLFLRRPMARLGVAPLTSMYWFSETNRHRATDWRPEIHDTDGLALWTGAGERIWRPLNNPSVVRTSVFVDDNPRGFGLLQRDRAFHNYEDDGVYYNRRPGVWIEPDGAWGPGAVMLLEIPTDDEIHDNIGAFWVPAEPIRAGGRRDFAYWLHWTASDPYPAPDVGRVVHTRLGRAGVPGEPRPGDGIKFVVDFADGPIAGLGQRYDVEVVVDTSRGRIVEPYALQVVGTPAWRAVFDLHLDPEAPGGDPVELRCFLRLDGRALTETWLFQHEPFAF
ncbi:MAG: glucan biosynthesis protein [Alphaproteobacteria bacterium]